MNSVIDIIATYEISVNQLREQQQAALPTLLLCGDDSQFMDTAYIIEAISELRDKLPEDFSVIAARVVADLAQLHEMITDSNSLIKENNDILDEQVGDLREALETQLANVPETRFTRAILIGTGHMSYDEVQILNKVYDKLNVTHVNHEHHKDAVYCTDEECSTLREAIITEFSIILTEQRLASTLKFSNYVHSEAIMGYTSELVKVIKSKR